MKKFLTFEALAIKLYNSYDKWIQVQSAKKLSQNYATPDSQEGCKQIFSRGITIFG